MNQVTAMRALNNKIEIVDFMVAILCDNKSFWKINQKFMSQNIISPYCFVEHTLHAMKYERFLPYKSIIKKPTTTVTATTTKNKNE